MNDDENGGLCCCFEGKRRPKNKGQWLFGDRGKKGDEWVPRGFVCCFHSCLLLFVLVYTCARGCCSNTAAGASAEGEGEGGTEGRLVVLVRASACACAGAEAETEASEISTSDGAVATGAGVEIGEYSAQSSGGPSFRICVCERQKVSRCERGTNRDTKNTRRHTPVSNALCALLRCRLSCRFRAE